MTSTKRVREWRKNNPIKSAFINLRSNAKRRGIPFEISFEYFNDFSVKTKLLTNSGTKAESYSVDRINNEIGYIKGNLQVLSLSDNGYKGYLERSYYFEESFYGTGHLKIKTHKPDMSVHAF